ncbi:MAG TPA: hypothetical protein VK674_07025 [Candidatus Limnocylindria bacterium]|nr:hypothetical protein [Candidatus Limnocylindria bacterium]
MNNAGLTLSAEGHRVIVDGHSLHKTALNIAAGRTELPGIPAGTSVETLVDGPLRSYFGRLIGSRTVHTHVVLSPAKTELEAAAELQERLVSRGQVSPWDPATVSESRAQVEASYQLEAALRDRGAVVAQASS